MALIRLAGTGSLARHALCAGLGVLVVGAEHCAAQPVTTIITHGFTIGEKGAWVQAMADAIIQRASTGSIFRYEAATGELTIVPSEFTNGAADVVVIIFNWTEESAGVSEGPNWNYAQAAGDVLHTILRDATYEPGAVGPFDLVTGRVVHFIGHSRGACVNSEAVRRLALAGLAVDHVTTLDPHPVDGTLDAPLDEEWGDPTPVKWSNVAWSDNYWRADGGGFNALDFDGIPLDDAFDTLLSESALNCCAYSFAHSDVHLWYHGTLDIDEESCDGEQCINATMRDTWWPDGWTEVGWFHSYLGGGSKLRPAGQPPGIDPDPRSAPVLYNGAFDQATAAGWSHHGGGGNADILSATGEMFLRLGAGSGTSRRHNRFYLPGGELELRFDARVVTAAPGESIIARLISDDGDDVVIGEVDAGESSPWQAGTFRISSGTRAAGTWRLEFLTSSAAPACIVDLDNIEIVAAPINPADIAPPGGDGVVGPADLAALLAQWGVCDDCKACPADLGGDCAVGPADLAELLANWD
jgi:hypothetical protein